MSNSGRKINYGVRPAKCIERKMMRDMFNRLSSFGPLEKYRYVGFGSKYFSDFTLFHRYLNISEMISIEADTNSAARYEFNKPYSDIKLLTGKSTDLLPSLSDPIKNTIYWLDYDGRFERYMMEDIAIATKSISSGSVIAISFNSEPVLGKNQNEVDTQFLYDQLIEMVGEDYVSQQLDPKGWKTSKHLSLFIKSCVSDKISNILKSRNIGLSDEDKFAFAQVMFFTYSDGAKMTTISYVFFKEKERNLFNLSRMSDLYYFKSGDEPFEIKVPNLTIKEIRHIMEIMPDERKVNKRIFPISDVRELWENYRYFPSFSEVESF